MKMVFLKSKKKSVMAALIGHTLERYDLALYGYFAAILTPIFFPNGDLFSTLSALGTFAAGYLMRPLGGAFFGYIGDRYGRKKAFLSSVIVMFIPTFVIGILPPYSSIGGLAPIILIICRLFQGLCGGGEFSGAGIFVAEHLSIEKAGLGGSLVCATGLLGAALGTALGALFTLPIMPEWAWRLPFLIGAGMTLFSYLIRKNMQETPAFNFVRRNNMVYSMPLLEVFKKWRSNMLAAAAIGGCGHVFLYIPILYMNILYTTKLKLPPSQMLIISTLVLLWWVVLCPMIGILSDKIGIRKFMKNSALLCGIFAYPLFIYLERNFSVVGVVIFQLSFTIFAVGFTAPISGLFTFLFPTNSCYSGIGFSITLGQAILGGTTPLIAVYLTEITDDIKAPAYFVMFVSFVGLYGVNKMRNVTREDLAMGSFEKQLEDPGYQIEVNKI